MKMSAPLAGLAHREGRVVAGQRYAGILAPLRTEEQVAPPLMPPVQPGALTPLCMNGIRLVNSGLWSMYGRIQTRQEKPQLPPVPYTPLLDADAGGSCLLASW